MSSSSNKQQQQQQHQHKTRALIDMVPVVLVTLVATAAAAAQTAFTVQVASLNVLAPSWATPTIYPTCAAPLLPTRLRVARALAFISTALVNADVIALQETETTTNPAFSAALKKLGFR
jgi:mRNA deadenylase 3'-5' endonuclease subunit Ccr4